MIKEKINEWAKQSLGREDFNLTHPKDLSNGDYTLIVSDKTAEEDFGNLNKSQPEFISKIELVKPRFINIYLSKEFFKESLGEIIKEGQDFGKSSHAKGFKVMVEHTQPNPFKKFHIGHLMNNAIGEAVSRIMKANGAEVKTASYHGDVGMHVAKALWKDDYVLGAKAFEEDPKAKAEIQEINKKIYEKSDPEINARYEEGKQRSLREFEGIYQRLGSKFDFNFFESESAGIGKEIVLENIGKIFEESDGAIVYKGEKVGLHTRVFLNSEKLPTYEAKEVGLAKIKKEKYNFDQSITVTANEQDAFFKVVEVAIGEVFLELKGKLTHLSHGMLRLPTGKMSSRTGDVITAEELIESVKEKVKGDEQVAIGAIKYMILRQAIGNDIIFDIEKSVSTEGDSGVYLQYAYARTNSLLEKAE
ncbi:MAG: arginine--tRNA ligase, partial [Minisyncoccia bacterium]